jgi:hypothetical protein
MEDIVKTLLEKSTKTDDSGDAMRFAQAACNAANALAALAETKRRAG